MQCSGLGELLGLVEALYKHTLGSLLSEATEDLHYFHSKVCSEEAKVWVEVWTSV